MIVKYYSGTSTKQDERLQKKCGYSYLAVFHSCMLSHSLRHSPSNEDISTNTHITLLSPTVPKSPNLPHPGDCGGLCPLPRHFRDGNVPSHARGLQCGGPGRHGDSGATLRPPCWCGGNGRGGASVAEGEPHPGWPIGGEGCA